MAKDINFYYKYYKPFYGSVRDQMPRLIAEKRTPISVSELMKRKLETLNSSRAVRDYWWHGYIDEYTVTGDAIIYHPDGKIKLVLDAQPIREINLQSKLINNALALPHGLYEKLEGKEFTEKEAEKYAIHWLTREEAKPNPLWQFLARDPKLLNEYVDAVFARWNKAMGLFIGSAKNVPTMCLWSIGDEASTAIGTFLHGDEYGEYLHGRLIGVAPEAQDEKHVTSPNVTLEAKIKSDLN